MTTTPNEDAVPGGPAALNTPKDGEGPESEREKGLDPTSGSSEGLNALHGANSAKLGEVVTGEELYGRACFASCSPMLPITLADRLEFGTALVIQGYPSSQAAMMANDLEANDGALQMLARHRVRYQRGEPVKASATITREGDGKQWTVEADPRTPLMAEVSAALDGMVNCEEWLINEGVSDRHDTTGWRALVSRLSRELIAQDGRLLEQTRLSNENSRGWERAQADLAALTAGPQFFAVAGLVETDLKERYESLKASRDLILSAVPENWEETGAASIEAHAIDLIGIGYSFMENLATVLAADGPFKGWHPADDPAEFVIDAANKLDEARTYDADRRERASTILRRLASSGNIASDAPSGTSTDGERYGETVDAIAVALGFTRAPIAPSET